MTLAGPVLLRATGGRIMLAVDVSNWLRPDAATSPDRLFCHTYGRGNRSAPMIPGWPYSFIAALEPGRTSWTQVLDAVRLGRLVDRYLSEPHFETLREDSPDLRVRILSRLPWNASRLNPT